MTNIHDRKNRNDRRNRDNLKYFNGVVKRRITPETSVKAGAEKNKRLDDNDHIEALKKEGLHISGDMKIETKQEGQNKGRDDQNYIKQKNQKSFSIEHGPSVLSLCSLPYAPCRL
jgi:hypothetical protein